MLTEHLTTQAAASYLALDDETLRRMRRLGQGPPFRRFGRRAVRYHVDALRTWAAQQTHQQFNAIKNESANRD